METGLKDKVIVITGASGGIGRATAEAFASESAALVLHGNANMDALRELEASLDVPCLSVKADIRDGDDVDAMFAAAVEKFGRVDALVANAGIWPHDEVPIHKMSLERWNETVATNLTGTFLCARSFFKHLDERKPETASLVIVGSTAAVHGEEGHADYSATKAAITYGLTKSLKNEIVRIVPCGRVNAVCPGWTLTRMTEENLENSAMVTRTLQTRALKQIARAEDIARTIVFLTSDLLARHITGEIWTCAGGMEGRLLHEKKSIDPSTA